MVATFVQAHEAESDFNNFLGIDTQGLNQEDTVEAQKQAVMENLEKVEDKVNEELADTPAIAKIVVGKTNINIYFEGGDSIGIQVEDGKVTSIQDGPLEDVTLEAHISDNVFISLESDSFDLTQALKNKDITYNGVGFFGKIKSGMVRTVLAIIG
ncbi:hypothetical protein EXS74_00360 [Candidatus Woesearchaeota archaeon]|nr:hypothetical protein [Candidatus Woesearchaeota archaeon]